MPNWTDEQKLAIHTRGGNLLVSAAAGSGKTAVLSARIGEFVEKGGSLERLLIVTFTNAAAGEMRTRIAKELTERAAKHPENAHLRRQSLTLYKAKIQTIDSYGMDLLRRHFSEADMAPDFTVMDETELTVIKATLWQEQLEEYYRTFPPGFGEFCALFGEEINSNTMDETVFGVARELESYPFADTWPDRQKVRLLEAKPWCGAVCRLLLPRLEEYLGIFEEIAKASPYPHMEIPLEERDLLQKAVAALKADDWDGFCKVIRAFSFPNANKNGRSSEREAALYKEYRTRLKDWIQKSDLFSLTEAQCQADLNVLRPAITFLLDAVTTLRQALREEMKKRNSYSFSALAEAALHLTVSDYNHETGEFIPTAVALEERAAYDEVLIDEYQDVSDLQDLFFRAVTDNNCFAVGDVKQSIYGFRGANTANFLKKKGEKTEDGLPRQEKFEVIALNRNFRSKKGILDFSNFLFRGLFSPQIGGIEYNDDEALFLGRGEDVARPDPAKAPHTELVLLPCKHEGGSHYSKEQNRDVARLCAGRIKETIEGGATVYDKNLKTVRPMVYSDIAILLRYASNTPLYKEVFREWGIPLLTADGETFLDTPEVQGVVAFLGAVNDPWDDRNLFVALTGNVFAFSPEEVAKTRLSAQDLPLWEGLKAFAKSEEKAKNALKILEKFRILAENLPMPKLVWEIYTATDYLALESAEDPRARSNLMKFYSFACRYSGGEGLSGFLEFTARAKESGKVKEVGAAPDGDFVRLMTVHKSKGLEFAWCLLPELERSLKSDNDNTLTHRTLGVVSKVKNPEGTARFTTLMREAVNLKNEEEDAAEELRVLYVALTRGRDRMTLVSRITQDQDKWPAWALHSEKGKVRLIDRLDANAFSRWILDRTAHHPDAGIIASLWQKPETDTGEIAVVFGEIPETPTQTTAVAATESGLSEEELNRRFTYHYNDRLSSVPAKVSVTEIAKLPADPDSELLLYEPPVTRPKFLDDTPQTGAEKGTALHTFCQFADFSADMEEEIARLTASGHLSEEAARGLNRRQLQAFLASDLVQSLATAQSFGREVRFTCAIPVSYYTGNPGDEGEMLMQGAMDLLIEEEDGYTVVDFKSDKASAETLLSRYSRQVNLYAAALRRLYDKPVKACKIWSFSLQKALDVKEEEL